MKGAPPCSKGPQILWGEGKAARAATQTLPHPRLPTVALGGRRASADLQKGTQDQPCHMICGALVENDQEFKVLAG